ncbi:MAG: hypothetical protein A2017_13120 [Lentisphaerae bacterium GWF2_44_16]|nr:MAG: hypothetical protein A2017_13120 [Lentisphaerae bacterium GWF2_44_16]
MNKQLKNIKLSLEEKAAQILISFRFGKKEISDYCVKKGWGGLHLSIWDYKGIEESRVMIEEFRAKSKVPPFITSDTECGFGMVMLQEATEFTTSIGLAASGDPALAYQAAAATAKEAKYVGLSWSYSPVVDINTNPLNPSTNIRSYGIDPEIVSKFALMTIKGYQENGLIATAKHFPGQGHSCMNSHFSAEIIRRSREEMENCELVSFENSIRAGVETIMTNHAVYPSYDKENLVTFSHEIVSSLLKNKLGFKGIIITDCLEMGPIKKAFSVEDSVVKAILAGHDIVLTENDYEKSLFAVMNGLKKDKIRESILDERIEKILNLKFKYGLFNPLPDKNRMPDLKEHEELAKKIARASIRIEKNDRGILPLRKIKDSVKPLMLLLPEKTEKMDIGVHHRENKIEEILKAQHKNTEVLNVPYELNSVSRESILNSVREASAVIFDTSFKLSSGQIGTLNSSQIELLKEIKKTNPSLVIIAVNPFALYQLPFADTIVFSYSSNEFVLQALFETIFGKISGEGKLPASNDADFYNMMRTI